MGGGGDALGEEDADVVDHAGAAAGCVAFFEDDVINRRIAFINSHREVGDGGIEHSGCPECRVFLTSVGIPISKTVMKDATIGFSNKCRGMLVTIAIVNPI